MGGGLSGGSQSHCGLPSPTNSTSKRCASLFEALLLLPKSWEKFSGATRTQFIVSHPVNDNMLGVVKGASFSPYQKNEIITNTSIIKATLSMCVASHAGHAKLLRRDVSFSTMNGNTSSKLRKLEEFINVLNRAGKRQGKDVILVGGDKIECQRTLLTDNSPGNETWSLRHTIWEAEGFELPVRISADIVKGKNKESKMKKNQITLTAVSKNSQTVYLHGQPLNAYPYVIESQDCNTQWEGCLLSPQVPGWLLLATPTPVPISQVNDPEILLKEIKNAPCQLLTSLYVPKAINSAFA